MNNDSLPEYVIEPQKRFVLFNLPQLWQHKELVIFLALRDLSVRYKQTAIGIVWAVIQPLFTMGVFSIFFGKLAKVGSDGHPYPVFAFAALLPWQLTSSIFTEATASLNANSKLLTKIYFPRLTIPFAASLPFFVDFLCSAVFGIIALLVLGEPLRWTIICCPLFLVPAVLSGLGAGIFFGAMSVRYKDIRYALPFLTQLWLFSSPIAYSSSLVPENLRAFYCINPLVTTIDGFRWSILGTAPPSALGILVSTLSSMIIFFTGLYYFARTEDSFADRI